jgi:hypothetical protein
VVKKSYCDWDRYKGFKATMHEANFELIEIPHVRQSGKNSADIRMVVDALDLCYTKSHVNTFVIVSGDSDFSPLVSKLRENAKRVIGVGVKQSTSDLLVANCDEFIFYDDLVREQRRAAAKRDERKAQPQSRRPSDEGNRKREEMEARKLQALEMVVETFDALVSERGDTGKIWASLLKDTLKRRRPDFSETYYGFRTFGNLLEEAQTRGLFEFGRDEKSGTYVFRGANAQIELPVVESVAEAAGGADIEPQLALAEPVDAVDELGAETAGEQPSETPPARDSGRDSARDSRRRGGRGRKGRDAQAPAAAAAQDAAQQEAVPASDDMAIATWPAPTPDLAEVPEPVVATAGEAEAPAPVADTPAPAKERRRAPRKTPARKAAAAVDAPQAADAGTAMTPAGAAADDRAVALDVREAVTDAGADLAAAPADAVGTEEEGDGQARPGRKKSSRPAHKAPSRKPATRAPRRPAKPKTPPENG